MGNIRGTIIDLKDFLFAKNTEVKIEFNGTSLPVFKFKEERIYIIPDYQREIKWKEEHLLVLMNDIYHNSKFLGNVILANSNNKDFEIIDGQQRIVMLNMLVHYIKEKYGKQIVDLDDLIEIKLNCFEKSKTFIDNNYSLTGLDSDVLNEVKASDKYDQITTLINLYNYIDKTDVLNTISKARLFINNLRECQFNVVISNENDRRSSTEYYIDVNLKGIKLDVEEIFKGYLFSLDTSNVIRDKWVKLKQTWFDFNEQATKKRSDTIYPLMKIINHYLHCTIFSLENYRNIVINDNFELVRACEINNDKYNVGDHIINVINDSSLMRQTIDEVTEFIKFITLVIAGNESVELKTKFSGLQDQEYRVIVNFLGKMIKDKKLQVPKSLIVKYYFTVLKVSSNKNDLKKIYAVYMFNGLFALFGDSKKTDIIINILKSNNFYSDLLEAIKGYFSTNNIADSKLKAILTSRSNTENEDLQFKCKTLATIYNYFEYNNKLIQLNCEPEIVNNYLNNILDFSMEHLIVNNSCAVTYILKDKTEEAFTLPKDLISYKSYIYNFIFVPYKVNHEDLKEYSLENKIKILNAKISEIKCNYSLMVIKEVTEIFNGDFDEKFDCLDEKAQTDLKKYWLVDFKENYSTLVNKISQNLIKRFASIAQNI